MREAGIITSLRWLAGAVLALLLASQGWAENGGRYALLIGNSEYRAVQNLANPVNDVADLGAAFTRLGFDVTLATDLGGVELNRALGAYARKTRDAEIAVIYFAGHGLEIDGQNYLLPVDARIEHAEDVAFEAIALNKFLQALGNANTLRLLLVDACRDNPFLQNMKAGTRSLGRGLARVEPTAGIVVGYAARSGTVALDGEGRNSPYAEALLRHVEEPGLEIGKLFRKVRDTVYRETGGRQEPFTYGSLPATDIFLAARLAPVEIAPSAPVTKAPPASEPEAAALLRPDAPDWCAAPANPTRAAICGDPELLDMDKKVEALLERQMQIARTGAVRGQALIAEREWRLSRDACANDRGCILRSYQLRLIALDEFSGKTLSTALVIRSVQEELNRLSCGAGVPDGVSGARTARSLDLAASLVVGLEAGASPEAIETLASLRSLPNGLCSVILRARENPRLLEGNWRVVPTGCPGIDAERLPFTIRLRHDGDDVYSASSPGDRESWGGRLHNGSFSLVRVMASGHRQPYSFAPAEDPFVMQGEDHLRCTYRATR